MDVDLSRILTLATLALLAAEIATIVALTRIMQVIDHRPGSRLARTIYRTIVLMAVSQVVSTANYLRLDLLNEGWSHPLFFIPQTVACVISTVALVWAWTDFRETRR